MLEKLLGKLMAYSGNLLAVAGLIEHNLFIVVAGIIVLVLGCIVHEVNEK